MDRNPQRGCGTKTSDSYYLEGDIGTSGPLWAWTWFLGDGLDHVLLVSRNQVPTRSVVLCNPAAILAYESFVGYGSPIDPIAERKQAYRHYLGKTRDVGSADHVGLQHYTPWSFAEETMQHGPSRKITKQMAKVFAELFLEHGPFPMLFSHSQIPLFATEDHKLKVLGAVLEAMEGSEKGLWLDACWKHDEWGQYSMRGQTPGNLSFLVPILDFMNMVKKTTKLGEPMPFASWHEAKKLVAQVRYEDQIFGASWMTKVTYTLPKEGKEEAREKARRDIPGVDILDLEEYEQQKYEDRISQSEGAD